MFDMIPNNKIREVEKMLNDPYRKISYRKIAEETGVSIATVSRVKNGKIKSGRRRTIIIYQEDYKFVKDENKKLRKENKKLLDENKKLNEEINLRNHFGDLLETADKEIKKLKAEIEKNNLSSAKSNNIKRLNSFDNI